MKKLLIAMMGAVFLLAACGGGDEPAPADEAPAEEPAEDAAETTAGDYDAAAAEQSYGSCMGCHGPNMEGASGPALKDRGLSYDHILSTIENGATGMPPGLVSGSDAENLAAWIADQN